MPIIRRDPLKALGQACHMGTAAIAMTAFACGVPGAQGGGAGDREIGSDGHEVSEAAIVTTVDIYQDATGAFSSFQPGYQSAGTQIVWHFPTASPGNAVVRRVMGNFAPYTYPYSYVVAPYTPTFANELAGPMIKAPSGIFVLGPTNYPLSDRDASGNPRTTPCLAPLVPLTARQVGPMTTEYLCRDPAGPKGMTMPSTWQNPNITGVFIRLQWKDLQPTISTWNFDILERETDAAVANGKLYSLVIEAGRDGAPTWLRDPAPGGAGMATLTLDANDDGGASDNQPFVDVTTIAYRDLYKAALTQVAGFIKQDSAKYRALAYIKPSGANRSTGENRLPNGCKPAPQICNDYEWANIGYSKQKIYDYYADIIAHIKTQFPGKSMSYMLIQAGFPRVSADGCYLDASKVKTCLNGGVANPPSGTEQTETIIANALGFLAGDGIGAFVVEHQGLDLKPTFPSPPFQAATDCPVPLDTNGQPYFGNHGGPNNGPSGGGGCPNQWVTATGLTGKPTMFQTSAPGQVGNNMELASTLDNLWTNSLASALEIYEERAWQANNKVLNAAAFPSATLGEWNTELHNRRRMAYVSLGDPEPRTYTFTLGPPVIVPPNTKEFDYYVDPRRQPVTQAGGCLDGFSPCIIVW